MNRLARIFLTVSAIPLILACALSRQLNQAAQEPVTEPTTVGIHEPDQPEDAPTTIVPGMSGEVIFPDDLVYLGAFRLPGGDEPPVTFGYGGNAMTYHPSGSLFIMGHERIAYGEVPNGNQVAEVSIPKPVISKNIDDLPTAEFIQNFSNIASGHFAGLDEIPRVGMQYLNSDETGSAIHLSWGAHLQFETVPSHAWFSTPLNKNDFHGEWYIGDLSPYSINGFLFDLPQEWANTHVNGYPLATGRYRDGGLGGMGPSLYAYRPWNEDGSVPASGSHLEYVTLLQYQDALTNDQLINCLAGYQHADEWEGGAFLEDQAGKQAVIFAGTKADGEKFWYGYLNPDDPTRPCVDTGVTDYVTCRMANGDSCPQADFSGCCNEEAGTCATNRGWWSSRFDAQILFYDPVDLARVAEGELESWQPQPYAVLDIDDRLFFNSPEWDRQMLGWGDQRRFRVGDITFDREHRILYLLELFGDGARPVVHAWQVQ